ncbi:MAG TPA: ABC transporter permease [Candidatus Binataceae bacterium]|nr:ABC transporter permease [Candidatus Binataceae bacterium]
MASSFSETFTRPDLLRNLVWAELTARYKTTAFGVLWFIVNPMLMMGILVLIFGRIVNLDIPNYPAFVLSALLPWTFFSMGMTNAATSLSRAAGLVKRVRIPRAFVPLSALVAELVHFLISLVMLFALMALMHVRVSPLIVFLPVIIVLEMAFLIGAGLLVASLNVLYRDVEHILSPGLQALFYFTPTFYPLSYVPKPWVRWYLMNPMAGIIELYRNTLVAGWPASKMVVEMALITSMVTLVAGIVIFRRLEPHFDDYI